MKNSLIMVAASMLSVAAVASHSLEGTVLTFDGDADETYSEVISGDVTKVIKKGTGKLTLTANSADFHGAVSIEKGVVVATHFNALGRGTGEKGTTSVNTITVADGAQLRATFDADRSDGNSEGRGFRSIIRVSGSGPDGTGAFYYDHAVVTKDLAYWLIWELRLDADATIGGSQTYFARTANLQSHTLTVKTVGTTHFYYGFVTNPGNIRIEGERAKVWSSTLNGTAANVFELAGNEPYFHFYNANPIEWSLLWNCSGKGTVEVDSWKEDKNVINGSVDFLGTRFVVWPPTGRAVTFNGPLRSKGYVNKGGSGSFYVQGPTNEIKYIYHEAGPMVFRNNQTNVIGYATVTGESELRFEDAGLTLMTNGSVRAIGRYTKGAGAAKVAISGKTDFRLLDRLSYLHAGVSAEFTKGVSERTRGTVAISDGACVSNNFQIGNNGQGAVYLDGASLYAAVPASAYTARIGAGANGGYGYLGATNSTLTVPRYMQMAIQSADSTGFFV